MLFVEKRTGACLFLNGRLNGMDNEKMEIQMFI